MTRRLQSGAADFNLENVVCVKNNILLLVFLFAFFALPLIFTLLATSITDFLTAGIKLPLLCVNRSHIVYVFRAVAKAIQHSVNIASSTFIRSCGYPPIKENVVLVVESGKRL